MAHLIMSSYLSTLAAVLSFTALASHTLLAAPTRFTVAVAGKGPDVILIPGLASPASVWDKTVAHLNATHRVHVLQVAGFAGAPAGENATGAVIGPLVEQVAAYISENQLRTPAIIGHSMGGAIALMLGARHPAAAGRIMVVDALPFFPLVMNPKATVESIRPMADGMRDFTARQTAAEFAQAQAMTLQRLVKSNSARAALLPLVSSSDPSVTAHALHDVLTTDIRPELCAIQTPLAILYAFDPVTGFPAEAVDRLYTSSYAAAKKTKLVRIDETFHFIMLDQPQKFAEAVDEFLSETVGGN